MAKVRRNASTASSGSGSGTGAAGSGSGSGTTGRATSPNTSTSTPAPLQDPSSSASPSSTSTTDPSALATTLPSAPTPTFEQFSRSLATELSLPDLTSPTIPADIRQAISRLQREIFNISMTLSLTRKAGHQLVDVGTRLEASKHSVDRTLAATSHRVTLLDAEAVELRKACKDCRSTLGSMRSELAQARDELKLRRAMEGDLKATKVKFAACMEGMEKECDKLRKECAKLKEQNEQLLSQLKAAKKTLENAEKTLSRQAAQQAQAQAQAQQQQQQQHQVQQGAAQAAAGKPPQAQQQQQQQQAAKGGSSGAGGGNHVAPKQAQQSQQQRTQAPKTNVPAPVPAAGATPNGTAAYAHAQSARSTTAANAHAVPAPMAAAVPAPHDANARSAASIAQAAADGAANHVGHSDDEADDDDMSDEEDDGEEDEDDEDEEDDGEDDEGDEEDAEDDEGDHEDDEDDEEQEKSYNDLARDFLRSLELKDYAGFCSNVAHLVTHEHAQQVNDWNALAIGALWLIALAGDCHGHAHVQNVVESLPDVRYQHAWVQLIAQLHEYAMANEPREFYNALEQVVQSHMVKQVAPLRDILNALRILQRIRFLNSFIMSEYHSNRFKRSNQVSLRMALFKTDFRDVVQLRQWLERELEGSDTQLALAGGGKNLADVRTLKNKLHDKLKGAENTYKKALDYLTTSMPPLAPGLTVGK